MKLKKIVPPATTAPAPTAKNATKPTAAAKVTKEAGTTVDAAPAQKAPSKHIGRTSGMRVMEYQDATMAAQMKNKLTDEELATNWQTEFPNTVCRFEERPEVIKIVRKLFNERRHGKQQIFAADGVVIPKFVIDEKGRRVATEDAPSRRGINKKANATAAA